MDLSTYVAAAILSWTAVKGVPTSEPGEVARIRGIADDIAAVVDVPDEPPLFPHDAAKAETTVQLASFGFWESRFWVFVDNGDCNRREWKAAHAWAKELCDGGEAWSFWQIHPRYARGNGIALDGDVFKHTPDGLKGPDLVADRRTAARVALHMLRSSLRSSGTFCGYTGETGSCPKAKQRRDTARAWVAAHPF